VKDWEAPSPTADYVYPGGAAPATPASVSTEGDLLRAQGTAGWNLSLSGPGVPGPAGAHVFAGRPPVCSLLEAYAIRGTAFAGTVAARYGQRPGSPLVEIQVIKGGHDWTHDLALTPPTCTDPFWDESTLATEFFARCGLGTVP
jgi:hypothetical protein